MARLDPPRSRVYAYEPHPAAVLHPDDRALVDIIFDGEDDADATSETLPFDGVKTRIYELRGWLSRRVFGIRAGFALAVLIQQLGGFSGGTGSPQT